MSTAKRISDGAEYELVANHYVVHELDGSYSVGRADGTGEVTKAKSRDEAVRASLWG